MKNILLVEPNNQFSQLVVAALIRKGYTVAVVRSAQMAIDWLDRPRVVCDALITELALGAHSGVEVLHELRSHGDWLKIPVLIHSRIPPSNVVDTKVLMQQYGVEAFIQKGEGSLTCLERELARVTV